MFARGQLHKISNMNKLQKELNKLDEYELSRWEDSSLPNLYPYLKGNIFHRTCIKSYFSIIRDGYINANKGQYKYTYDASGQSYSSYKEWIALFDFIRPTLKDCIMMYHMWSRFFFDQKPATVVLQLDAQKLSDKLIPNTRGPKIGSKNYKLFLPHVEAWYPDPIPINFITAMYCSYYDQNKQESVFKKFDKFESLKFEEYLRSFNN